MVSKDQTIGAVICLVCVLVAVFYVVSLFVPGWLSYLGVDFEFSQFWLIAIPVLIAFIAILTIGAWIGWTMATTPPPKSLEEITADLEKENKTTKP